MRAEHLEFLVEEPSMEAFLAELLPRLFGERATFAIHTYQGKKDLMGKLGARLRGYAKWLPKIARIVVLVDRDGDDCLALKRQMEREAASAGLLTRTVAGGASWRVVNRVVVEELESWFFGEWTAVQRAFPRTSPSIPKQAAFRKPDSISGGTWEALERVLRTGGYFTAGLRKAETASAIGKHFDPVVATSPSFVTFREALTEALS